MAVREAWPHPQFLSTDRHLMQGYVDVLGCDWNAAQARLQGVSTVVGGEPYRVIIATNGYRPVAATIDETIEIDIAKSGLAQAKSTAALRPVLDSPGIIELILRRPTSGPVAWGVNFQAP